MQKTIAILFVFSILFFSLSSKTEARKVLPQAKSAAKSSSQRPSGSGINVYPRLRADRKALVVAFANLQKANSVSYMLVYKTNGQEEGAGGSVNPSQGNSASRELLFGTCSKNVCRYHTSITNMRLEVTTELKSGKRSLKRFRVKI